MPQLQLPIKKITPVKTDVETGFDIEFDLENGGIGRAQLRSHLPSWQRVHFASEPEPVIELDVLNPGLLYMSTMDHEIRSVRMPSEHLPTS